MNEQLLPLLLEHTAGKRSNEILKNINEQDQNNQQLSIWFVQDQLQLFDKAMQLQLDALAFAAEHVSQWSEADRVIVAMACRAFNHLKPAAYLLLAGYWAESWHLQRAAFEALTRAVFFYENPDKVSDWLKKGKMARVSQKEVQELINRIYGGETYNAHRKVYDILSYLVHPNREAIELETWNDEEKKDKKCIGIRNVLGGYIDMRYFRFQFHTLLMMASNATTALKFAGLRGKIDTWEQQCDKLYETIYATAPNELLG